MVSIRNIVFISFGLLCLTQQAAGAALNNRALRPIAVKPKPTAELYKAKGLSDAQTITMLQQKNVELSKQLEEAQATIAAQEAAHALERKKHQDEMVKMQKQMERLDGYLALSNTNNNAISALLYKEKELTTNLSQQIFALERSKAPSK